MIKTFTNFPELTSDLAFALIDRLSADATLSVEFGKSNQSCSAYVNVTIIDNEGDLGEEFKVRFSDHADRYGSDVTIRIDDQVDVIEDDGDYAETRMEDWRYEEALDRAVAAVEAFVAAAR